VDKLKLITLKDNLNLNIVNKIYDFKDPLFIYIPIFKDTAFKINDYIEKNTYFGNYISSISGYIRGTKEININNKLVTAIKIENDFKENSDNKKQKKKITNKEELINVLNEYSLINIANKIKLLKNIQNLIVSSIDEESYKINEFIRLSNNYTEILEAVDLLLNILGVDNAILATKSINYKSIKNVKSIIGMYPSIKINLVPDKYLISYKKFLCEYLNVLEEESLVLTTNDIYNTYNVLKGKNITEQLITISGDAIEKSFVINVRLNVSLSEIIKEYIKIRYEDYEIFINGYLCGIQATNVEDIIITKEINSIIINKKELPEESECINCGACLKICPVNINVKACYFNKVRHKKCLGCGLCEYVCPANLKLKSIVRGDNNEK